MAQWKQTILFLLMIVWILERVLSHENLSHHRDPSRKENDSYVTTEYFDLFTKLSMKNQSNETEVDETENPAFKKEYHLESGSKEVEDNLETNSTDSEKLAKKNSTNGTEGTEEQWSFSKIFEYLLSLLHKLDTEENSEEQKTSDEIRNDEKQRQSFNKRLYSENNEACRADNCDSIPNGGEHYRSVGGNPDVDFDSSNKVSREKTQNHQHNSAKSSEGGGGISERKSKSASEREKYFRSVDSNPDVAFDGDDELEKREPLKSTQASEVSRNQNEEMSENNSEFYQEGKDHNSEVDYNSDFVFSEERKNNGKPREAALDEDSGNSVEKYHDSSESNSYFSLDTEKPTSEEEFDSTEEQESNKTPKNKMHGNDFLPYESELKNMNEFQIGDSDANETEKMPNDKEISHRKENSLEPTEGKSNNRLKNLVPESNAMNIENEKSQETDDSNTSIGIPENSETESSPKVQEKPNSSDLFNGTAENKRSSEKPKHKQRVPTEKNTESLTKHKMNSSQAEPEYNDDEDYDEEDDIDEDEEDDIDEDEEDDIAEDEEDDLDEDKENDIGEDEDSYPYNSKYFDDFLEEDDVEYRDDSIEYIFQDFVLSQTDDNVMGNPQVITDKPYEEINYNYSNTYKQAESFNTILEYLYKHSNNPLFFSLSEQNNTEADDRTM